jgi:lipopolysaccharide transport system ATP-binding protein
MSGDIAIRVRGLGKKYTIGGPQERFMTFRDVIVKSVKAPFRRLTQKGADQSMNEFWALKDVSFDVHKGEVIGIIGRNGAGKSTLLKILSRIVTPTEGEVDIYGRVGSLLEVGTGFHGELTGRENIFLSGSILGMRKREMEQKFDEIVKFSEIDKFIDTPVKRYSSGMYVRLAFAVAAHLDQEILIVDEVLAVGDASFQKKCLGKMGDVAKEGRTVLFVSHNMTAIVKLCKDAIWMDNGTIRAIETSGKSVQSYLASGMLATGAQVIFPAHDNEKEAYLTSIELLNGNNEITSEFDVFSPIKVNISFYCTRRILNFRIDVLVSSYDGIPVFATTSQDYDKINHQFESGSYQIQAIIPGQFLASREYYLTVNLCEVNSKNFDLRESIIRFRIVGNPYQYERNLGFLIYPFEWNLIDSIETL